MTDTLIRLEDVAKVFITDEMETHALAAIDLEIRGGEYVAIEGPSGSGKTTLLSILGLLDTPSTGAHRFNDIDVRTLSAARRADVRGRHIGFIFQSFNLLGELSVHENVELPLVYGGVAAAERRRRVADVLERVGMSHRARHRPAQLSGGQQQRVAVARALATNPLVLLADEPTGNLDTHNGDMVMQLLSELHQSGATICVVTHNPEYARQAQRVVHLLDGHVVSEREAA